MSVLFSKHEKSTYFRSGEEGRASVTSRLKTGKGKAIRSHTESRKQHCSSRPHDSNLFDTNDTKVNSRGLLDGRRHHI